MSGSGHGSKVSAAQRAEVLRLLGKGWSVRAVAKEVFGDERFRGRVERIKARHDAESDSASGPVAPADLQGLSQVEAIKQLFERRLAALLAEEVPPSMNELHRLLDVHRQLETIDAVERMNALTRRQQTFTESEFADLLVFGGPGGTADEPGGAEDA